MRPLSVTNTTPGLLLSVASGARTTRASATFVSASLGSVFALRCNWLDQAQRLFFENGLPLQNSSALNPLARQDATRSDHTDAFAMRASLRSA
jgi:hypothetical protein